MPTHAMGVKSATPFSIYSSWLLLGGRSSRFRTPPATLPLKRLLPRVWQPYAQTDIPPDFLSKYERRRGLFGSLAIRLTFLRAVDAVEAY
jgi:hypothetical protein